MDWNIVLAMIGTGGLTGLVNWLINLKVNQSKARLDRMIYSVRWQRRTINLSRN